MAQRLPRRLLHISAPRRDLVGPPHPISNIRPVIYSDRPPPPNARSHPYSLHEFDPGVPDYEMHYRLEMSRMDEFNHQFWYDVRIFFFRRFSQLARL
jgi:hypothetical protein